MLIYAASFFISMQKKVALLDMGAQLIGTIRRRVTELGYECDTFPYNVNPNSLTSYGAIIISGGPQSVYRKNAKLPDKGVYALDIPVLGICYGMQAMAFQLGGTVTGGERGQYGRSYMNITSENQLFCGLNGPQRVLMSHFDTVTTVPKGFQVFGKSDGLIAAMGNPSRRLYATQFHPEMLPISQNGGIMFHNFLTDIADFPEVPRRSIDDLVDSAKRNIWATLGSDKHVMIYWSGGVDSTLLCLLCKETIEPERIHCRILDTGYMRMGEIERVQALGNDLLLKDVQVLNVAQRMEGAVRRIKLRDESWTYAGPLFATIDPELKRKIFGAEYAAIAREEIVRLAQKLRIKHTDIYLGQGTLFPDAITSADKRVSHGETDTIKTHHNLSEALADIPKLEPLIEWFKDQVRESLAIKLRRSNFEGHAYRQPFPGPGLLVRTIGWDGSASLDYLPGLDRKVHDYAKSKGFHGHVLPFRMVGQQGDKRSHKNAFLVTGEVDYGELRRFIDLVPNDIPEINAVLYSPGRKITQAEAFGMTTTLMTLTTIEQSALADRIVSDIAEKFGFLDSKRCSQLGVFLAPTNFGIPKSRSVIIRPYWTLDHMSGMGMIPCNTIPEDRKDEFFPEEMFNQICTEIPKNMAGARVILDANDKPPRTFEPE